MQFLGAHLSIGSGVEVVLARGLCPFVVLDLWQVGCVRVVKQWAGSEGVGCVDGFGVALRLLTEEWLASEGIGDIYE